jgi:hypothetical protein
MDATLVAIIAAVFFTPIVVVMAAIYLCVRGAYRSLDKRRRG